MGTDEENRLAEALRTRAARNRRELEEQAVNSSGPDPVRSHELTLHDLAELMCAEFDVTRNNQRRLEDGLRQASKVQQAILTELSAIRTALQALAPDASTPNEVDDSSPGDPPRGSVRNKLEP